MKFTLQDVGNNYQGFAKLIDLAARTRDTYFDHLEVEIYGWFAANMSAPLGALLYRAGRQANTVTIPTMSAQVKRILSRNGLLCNYGQEPVADVHRTTIQYQRFETKDGRHFAYYLGEHLLKGKDIPAMSTGLKKRFRENVFELFSNAVIHSETRLGIFTCGQSFPSKRRLDFTVVDLGIGIRENIRRKAGLNLTAEGAIQWAMEGKNTTKRGAIPGGLGLKLLCEFILMNEGRIQIVSDRGYWELSAGQVRTEEFSEPFPGTAVNIEINTADTKSYRLHSEIHPGDLF